MSRQLTEAEIIDIQHRIIKLYSGLVYEMFNVLLENKYMTAEEADASSFTKQINLAAQLKQCISEDAT